jgi:O-antigen ligase
LGALTAMFGSASLLVLWRPRASAMVFLGLTLTACILWLFVPLESLDRLATIPEQVSSGDLNDRLNIWTAGWQAFRLAPWFGYGAGTFAAAAGLAPADTAHNTLMAVLVTGGVAGTLLFVAIVGSVCWYVIGLSGLLRVALGTSLAVWLVTSMVGSVEENRTTWLLFAIVALGARLAREDPAAMELLFGGYASPTRPAPQTLAVRSL